MQYLYTAWFRDAALMPDQNQYEWSACIIIEAESDRQAREWGDYLAIQRATRSRSLHLFSSGVENTDSWPQRKIQTVPRVSYGEQLSDQLIGW